MNDNLAVVESEDGKQLLSLSKGYVKYSTLMKVMQKNNYNKRQFDKALTDYMDAIREEQKNDLVHYWR